MPIEIRPDDRPPTYRTGSPAPPPPLSGEVLSLKKSRGPSKKVSYLIFGVIALVVMIGSIVPSTPPAWDTNLSLDAEIRVKERLRDPGSAEFRNIRAYAGTNAEQRHICGEVNSKNGFGGYSGFTGFFVLIEHRDNRVLSSPAVLQSDFPALWPNFRAKCEVPVKR